jgi:metallophosphoesterase superfamily enzyme
MRKAAYTKSTKNDKPSSFEQQNQKKEKKKSKEGKKQRMPNVILQGNIKKNSPADSSELTRMRRIAAANLPHQDIMRGNHDVKIKELGSDQVRDFRLYRVIMKNTRAAVPNIQ